MALYRVLHKHIINGNTNTIYNNIHMHIIFQTNDENKNKTEVNWTLG